MPPTTNQRAMIGQFMSITGLPEKTAGRLLKTSGWKIDQASDSLPWIQHTTLQTPAAMDMITFEDIPNTTLEYRYANQKQCQRVLCNRGWAEPNIAYKEFKNGAERKSHALSRRIAALDTGHLEAECQGISEKLHTQIVEPASPPPAKHDDRWFLKPITLGRSGTCLNASNDLIDAIVKSGATRPVNARERAHNSLSSPVRSFQDCPLQRQVYIPSAFLGYALDDDNQHSKRHQLFSRPLFIPIVTSEQPVSKFSKWFQGRNASTEKPSSHSPLSEFHEVQRYPPALPEPQPFSTPRPIRRWVPSELAEVPEGAFYGRSRDIGSTQLQIPSYIRSKQGPASEVKYAPLPALPPPLDTGSTQLSISPYIHLEQGPTSDEKYAPLPALPLPLDTTSSTRLPFPHYTHLEQHPGVGEKFDSLLPQQPFITSSTQLPNSSCNYMERGQGPGRAFSHSVHATFVGSLMDQSDFPYIPSNFAPGTTEAWAPPQVPLYVSPPRGPANHCMRGKFYRQQTPNAVGLHPCHRRRASSVISRNVRVPPIEGVYRRLLEGEKCLKSSNRHFLRRYSKEPPKARIVLSDKKLFLELKERFKAIMEKNAGLGCLNKLQARQNQDIPCFNTILSPRFQDTKIANLPLNSYFATSGVIQIDKGKDSLEKIFESYRGQGDADKIVGVEGTMKYLMADLGLNLENAEMLVPLEIIQAPSVGEMAKDGFIDGWKAVNADTLSKQKSYLKSQIYLLSTDPILFKRVYKHVFICAREKGAKALPLDHALTYWHVLFSPPGKSFATATTDWAELWFEFLEAKWSKSVNKDMWNMTLEFLLKALADETMSFWSEDGAWPGVIDEFVVHVKEKKRVSEKMETD